MVSAFLMTWINKADTIRIGAVAVAIWATGLTFTC